MGPAVRRRCEARSGDGVQAFAYDLAIIVAAFAGALILLRIVADSV
jgi:hypothetical protein